MKLADPDEISGSNLNRIRYDFTKVGKNKCAEAAEQIWQMNPYGEVHAYPEGLNADNIDEFLTGPPKLDLLLEEVDNLEMKIRLRLKARELGIPVIMVTDNGDGVIVDIERYDLEPGLELFSGAAGKLTLEEFQKIPPQEMPRLAAKIAGPKMTVPRMLLSLLEVGKTLYSWPQLGDAATLAGVVIAYLTKRIALGEKTPSGKLEVSLDAIFDPDYRSPEKIAERESIRQDFMKKIGLN
jgi:molybdopterin/thiamine biosynthesis adenylyltransferase